MQSPCLKEVEQVCLHGCCPNPLIGLPAEPRNSTSKPKSTAATCRRNFVSTTATSFYPNTHFTNHESLPSLKESFTHFIKAYPQYSDTTRVDQIRSKEYYHLSLSNHVCFDYIGIGLFSHLQLQAQNSSTIANASSSPQPRYSGFPLFRTFHKSVNLKSQLLHGGEGLELESAIKKRIMGFLNISENDYCMVFTANKSSAFKLVAESYPFQSSRKLLTVYDYKSEAVESMVSTSKKRGARFLSTEFKWPRLRIRSEKLRKMIVRKRKNKKSTRGLFVFPLQSRLTGASYSYQWMSVAQENGWHVLLDACALGPKDMDSFGLSLFQPDFLVCSFYKVFGENPTGFACLFVKKSMVSVLEPSACTGIVSLIPAKKLSRLPDDSSGTDTDLEKTFTLAAQVDEQGEISEVKKREINCKENRSETSKLGESDEVQENNRSLEIECRGLDQVDSLGLILISSRGRCLTNWLINALLKLQHPDTENKIPLVRIYGPKVKFDRGPALAFNLYDWKGEKVEPVLIQKLADRSNISLSHGFLHQIWFSDKYEEEKERVIERRKSEGKEMRGNKKIADQGITVVTTALGFLANFEDTYRLWSFVARFLDADFVEKERWRYTALNQKTIEV
ncbi:hypothetical protein LguiB_003596 [Lonicera macranthoides]